MGALVDPSRFNTSIEQENLTPKQPGYYIQKRKEEEELKRQQEERMRSEPKTISSAPKLSTADQYSQVKTPLRDPLIRLSEVPSAPQNPETINWCKTGYI